MRFYKVKYDNIMESFILLYDWFEFYVEYLYVVVDIYLNIHRSILGNSQLAI